jgi:hypothetical protein
VGRSDSGTAGPACEPSHPQGRPRLTPSQAVNETLRESDRDRAPMSPVHVFRIGEPASFTSAFTSRFFVSSCLRGWCGGKKPTTKTRRLQENADNWTTSKRCATLPRAATAEPNIIKGNQNQRCREICGPRSHGFHGFDLEDFAAFQDLLDIPSGPQDRTHFFL